MSTDQPLPLVVGQVRKGWGVMSKWLEGSPVAWAALAVSIIVPSAAMVYNYAYLGAHLSGQVSSLSYQITRNREETTDKLLTTGARIDNMYTSMNTLYTMRTDIEVIKAQIQQVNDAVRRIESAQQHHHVPLAGPRR